jgi:hypothetical protein
LIFGLVPTLETFLAFIAIALVVLECCGRFSARTPGTPKLAPSWWIAGLIASHAAVLLLLFCAFRNQHPAELWRSMLLPIGVVENRYPDRQIVYGSFIATALLCLSAFQSYALLALYRGSPSRVAVRIGCGIMLALSCVAPAVTSFDPYGYVKDSLLGYAAYRPPNVPFQGEYRVFDLWFGGPNRTPYGPLWIPVVSLVTSLAPTLLGKLLALRAFGLMLYLLVIAGLRALGMPARIRNVFALNPGLMYLYVANSHNDLIAIAILVGAALVVRTRPAFAFTLVAAAGLLKLPYALLGLPILAGVRSIRLRIAGSVAMLAGVLAVSWFALGANYFVTLSSYGSQNASFVVRELADAIAVALLLVAAAGGRRLRSGVWIFPTLGAVVFPWYFVWGLPYALARRRVLSYFLVCFPFVTMLAGNPFVVPSDVVIVVLWIVAMSLREPRAGLRGYEASSVAMSMTKR